MARVKGACPDTGEIRDLIEDTLAKAFRPYMYPDEHQHYEGKEWGILAYEKAGKFKILQQCKGKSRCVDTFDPKLQEKANFSFHTHPSQSTEMSFDDGMYAKARHIKTLCIGTPKKVACYDTSGKGEVIFGIPRRWYFPTICEFKPTRVKELK